METPFGRSGNQDGVDAPMHLKVRYEEIVSSKTPGQIKYTSNPKLVSMAHASEYYLR
jgi:hypothetical protein